MNEARGARSAITPAALERVVLLLCAALLTIVFIRGARTHRAELADASSFDALSAVPRGSIAVLSLDVNALRNSELGRFLVSPKRGLSELHDIASSCGYDPSSAIGGIAVVVPAWAEGARAPDFAVIVAGQLDGERIVACTRRILAKRGRASVIGRTGAFTTVSSRGGTIAVRPGGPLLFGGWPVLKQIIAVLDGKAERLERDPVHRSLRNALGNEGDIVLSVRLPEHWLERLLERKSASDAAAAHLRAVGLRIDARADVALHARFVCDDARACGELGELSCELLRAAAPSAVEPLCHGAQRVSREPGVVDYSARLTRARAQVLVEELGRSSSAEPPR